MEGSAMLEAKCGACGTSIAVNDSLAGKIGRCPKCGGKVVAPGAFAQRKSTTASAVEEALAAMDAKERSRGKEPKASRRKNPVNVFDLEAKRAPAAAPAPNTTTTTTSTTVKAKDRRDITKRAKLIGGTAALALCFGIVYLVSNPAGNHTPQHREEIIRVKEEADRLAESGKADEAYKKYGAVILMAGSKPPASSDLQRALQQARDARVQLANQMKNKDSSARSASYSH
jgi:DNA-directed RNA polymerase subunit RPC12/RpoP